MASAILSVIPKGVLAVRCSIQLSAFCSSSALSSLSVSWAGKLYCPAAQLPKSISRHRSLQNGRFGFPSQLAVCLQIGHFINNTSQLREFSPYSGPPSQPELWNNSKMRRVAARPQRATNSRTWSTAH